MTQIDQIKKLVLKLKEGSYDIWHEDDSRELLERIPELEEKQNIKYPESYLDYVSEIGVSFLKNDHFNMDFFGEDGLSTHNVGKRKMSFMKDFIVFALGARSALFFMDVKNILGKGENAIYRMSWDSRNIGSACFLAKDFVELFEIIAGNKKPNEKPVM